MKRLGAEATLAAAPDADPYAVEQARALLREAGVRTLHESLPGRGPVVRLGGAGADEALRALRAPAGATCRRATGSRSARPPGAPPSRWTGPARTASSTPFRPCANSSPGARWRA
ncbi:hypothetical protein STENM327S_02341 [Streptomyces tendae]